MNISSSLNILFGRIMFGPGSIVRDKNILPRHDKASHSTYANKFVSISCAVFVPHVFTLVYMQLLPQ